jgi:cytochrome c553
MSCSSCHKSGYAGANVDRTFPRTTCARCHDAQGNNGTSGPMGAIAGPNCVSCHVQHLRDTRWTASLTGSKPMQEPKR